MVVDYIRKELGKPTARGVHVILSSTLSASGGSLATVLELEEARALKTPGVPLDTGVYSLVSPRVPTGDDGEVWGPDYEPTLKRWMAPFILQARSEH